ncbi:MAG: KpsF/GutQ family sugar-phosphate isomerase [candidate division KSB1 bacterium]|nr:KpsF/GutQ family sugar-phosphate isomerase [candidate division KSB1 bacterium]MDZ7334864.1 KpsF/GutQ family sugar-phosphate isomerase [candidate division KSB1 bacterium]MDZ7400407.1 KpsF/GutQ family sugar-phosphate isomerase [candidate division KSB1 bacterium]
MPESNNKIALQTISIGKEVIRKEAQAIFDLEQKINSEFAQAVELLAQCKGRVIISGMGKSGIIGRKIAATLTSTGTAAMFLHPAEGMHGDLGAVHKDDVVICISKSGNTSELFQIFPVLKRIGVPIISIVGNRRSRIAERSDIVLDASVKEEACPFNLAPTSSTTAALVIGDALAVALLKRRNFTAEQFAMFHPGGSLGKKLSIKIDDVMFTGDRIPKVTEDLPLEKVIFEITSKRFGSTCVVDQQDRLIGIITDGDIRRLVEKTKDIWDLKASQIMTRNPKTVKLGTLAAEALKLMTDFSIMQVIIVDDNNHPRGIVHIHDLLEAGIL